MDNQGQTSEAEQNQLDVQLNGAITEKKSII